MRSRTIREGSVGLLILLGLGVFVGLVLWIRGIAIGDRSYKFFVKFGNVAGMQSGAAVRYRGVKVGEIVQVAAETNGVNATVQIDSTNLSIPKDVRIEANQAGFVGETSVDITPLSQKPLPVGEKSINPLSRQCNSTLIICNNDRVQGRIGVSFEELLRNTIRLSEVYTDPKFFGNVQTLTQNAADAAKGVTQLTNELSLLSSTARRELGSVSTAADSITRAANQTVAQVGVTASRFGNTADSLSNTAQSFGNTAERYGLTANELTKLVATTNNLVATNRGNLVGTLESIRQTSNQLSGLISSFTPAAAQLSSAAGRLNTTAGQIDFGGVLNNLQTLSANAATTSANLRDISTSLNNPESAMMLQRTLDSARATFENAQKITSDLDDLTGDPAFRENLKQLVNGLGQLVSSTEQLQQQVQVAQTIEPVNAAINATADSATSRPLENEQVQPNIEQAAPSSEVNRQNHIPSLFPPAPKKPLPQATPQPLAEVNK